MWKVIHLDKLIHLKDKIEVNQKMEIVTQRPRLQFTSNGLRWRGSLEWNQLPEDIRREPSIARFKRRTKD